MPRLLTQTRLRKALKKVNQPQTGWLDVFPAVIGKADGTVLTGTAGEIYVRNILNGQIVTVHNPIAPLDANTQVWVGRRVEEPNLWQVKNVRETFSTPAVADRVAYHAEQHVFPAADTVFIPRKQVRQLSVLVSDAENFVVQVYGSVARTATGIALIDNQEVDVSSYVPVTGAVYVNIEADDDGVLTVHEGTPFAAKELATAGDIPVPEAGKYRIASIVLFETMEALLDEHIVVPFPLEPDYGGVNIGVQIHAADEETTLNADDEFGFWNSVTGLVSKITWANIVAVLTAFFSEIGHTHESSGDAGHLHGLARWIADGSTTDFELPDIAEYIEGVSDDGSESDATTYSLSADGTQLLYDSAPTAAHIIQAHYVLATT